ELHGVRCPNAVHDLEHGSCAMIVVENVSRSFGAVRAVDDISFVAENGRITGLLGHNGAGKSTTLRILSTVLRADSGRALVDGHDCARDSLAVRRSLGVLPHASGLYATLTGRENIRYYGRLHGMRGAPRERLFARRAIEGCPRPRAHSSPAHGHLGRTDERPRRERRAYVARAVARAARFRALHPVLEPRHARSWGALRSHRDHLGRARR